jgi:peroxiredoxin
MKGVENMKNRILVAFTACISVYFAASVTSCFANTAPLQKGRTLPQFELNAPADARDKAYLGLESQERFEIKQIKSKFVIIEIFSMYCPHCQKDAPVVNELFELIEGDARLKSQIKLIGIGAGNSVYEVAHFKKIYKVEFPLFADADFSLHKLFGEVRTPFFVGVALSGPEAGKIIHTQLGNIDQAAQFLENFLKVAGLSP